MVVLVTLYDVDCYISRRVRVCIVLPFSMVALDGECEVERVYAWQPC